MHCNRMLKLHKLYMEIVIDYNWFSNQLKMVQLTTEQRVLLFYDCLFGIVQCFILVLRYLSFLLVKCFISVRLLRICLLSCLTS
jgi:hypothetical protein